MGMMKKRKRRSWRLHHETGFMVVISRLSEPWRSSNVPTNLSAAAAATNAMSSQSTFWVLFAILLIGSSLFSLGYFAYDWRGCRWYQPGRLQRAVSASDLELEPIPATVTLSREEEELEVSSSSGVAGSSREFVSSQELV